MLDAKSTLFLLLGAVAFVFVVFWALALGAGVWELFVGFVTNFFDTLGIGSFATTTRSTAGARRSTIACCRARSTSATRSRRSRRPTSSSTRSTSTCARWCAMIAAAARRIAARRADRRALAAAHDPARHRAARCSCSAACSSSASSGRSPRRARSASRAACSALGVAINFVLGALMTIGVGLYAPCLVLVIDARHEPEDGLPDHDGLVRVPDAGRERAVRAREELLARARRSGSRSAACRRSSSPA